MAIAEVTEPKEKRTASLTPQTWRDLEAIADLSGNSVGEILRRCVEVGLSEEQKRLTANMAYENAKLVNRKLIQRQSDIEQAIAAIDNPQASAEDKAAAWQQLKQKLMD